MAGDLNFLSIDGKGTVSITVYVQPKASSTRFAGPHGNAIKICITDPPVEGKANAAVAKFLAKLFHLPKSAITLQSGRQNRTKRFHLAGISYEAAEKIVQRYLSGT